MENNIVTHDFALTAPDDWLDKSMLVWSAPPKPGQAVLPNIVIAREQLAQDKTLSDYVNEQLKELMSQGAKFDLARRDQDTFAGRECINLLFSWESNGVTLKQQQRYIAKTDKEVISIVCTADKKSFGDHAQLFEQMLSTFRWAENV